MSAVYRLVIRFHGLQVSAVYRLVIRFHGLQVSAVYRLVIRFHGLQVSAVYRLVIRFQGLQVSAVYGTYQSKNRSNNLIILELIKNKNPKFILKVCFLEWTEPDRIDCNFIIKHF